MMSAIPAFPAPIRRYLGRFVARRPFAYRVARFPLRILWAVLTLRPLRALAYLCYAAGFLLECARGARGSR